ncbi:Uncharacterised protein [Mycobacterium tuberculosis]|nr:Uncharacterised protein [Mycobacterium tuberculosis]
MRAGCAAPSRYIVSRSVPVASASMRGSTPIFSEISMAGRNRSTAWPPVLRKAGARSTTVTSKPYRVSQYARTGPAMLAPEMRIRMATS